MPALLPFHSVDNFPKYWADTSFSFITCKAMPPTHHYSLLVLMFTKAPHLLCKAMSLLMFNSVFLIKNPKSITI